MPKTFRAGTYWIRADLGGDPERHHALYSGVPKGWNVGFNANNKRDIPPHLKVVDMAPDDSQEHWGEFGEHIYNKYVEGKRREWMKYKISVSDWEINRYLMKY